MYRFESERLSWTIVAQIGIFVVVHAAENIFKSSVKRT